MADQRNFDQKIFMFPEAYNQLRAELSMYWNPNPHFKKPRWADWQCGWAMAWEAETFVEYMNTSLDGVLRILPTTRDDELRIEHICKVFLTELRRKRGEPNP